MRHNFDPQNGLFGDDTDGDMGAGIGGVSHPPKVRRSATRALFAVCIRVRGEGWEVVRTMCCAARSSWRYGAPPPLLFFSLSSLLSGCLFLSVPLYPAHLLHLANSSDTHFYMEATSRFPCNKDTLLAMLDFHVQKGGGCVSVR